MKTATVRCGSCGCDRDLVVSLDPMTPTSANSRAELMPARLGVYDAPNPPNSGRFHPRSASWTDAPELADAIEVLVAQPAIATLPLVETGVLPRCAPPPRRYSSAVTRTS